MATVISAASVSSCTTFAICDATAEHDLHGPGTWSLLALDDSGSSLYYGYNVD